MRTENALPVIEVMLSDKQSALVEQLLLGGRYRSASEILLDGLRLLELRESGDEHLLAALAGAAAVGMADIGAQRYTSFDTPAGLDRHLAALAFELIDAHER